MKRVSVRLDSKTYKFINNYAKILNIPVSQAVREIFHLFKYIVIVKSGMFILHAIASTGSIKISNLSDGEKINVSMSDDDIAFIDSVASLLKVKRSTALRIILSTAIKFLKIIGLVVGE